MRPHRRLPSWKRLLIEYAAMVLTYVAVLLVTRNQIIALFAMIAAMFVGRWTRPKAQPPPPPPPRGDM